MAINKNFKIRFLILGMAIPAFLAAYLLLLPYSNFLSQPQTAYAQGVGGGASGGAGGVDGSASGSGAGDGAGAGESGQGIGAEVSGMATQGPSEGFGETVSTMAKEKENFGKIIREMAQKGPGEDFGETVSEMAKEVTDQDPEETE